MTKLRKKILVICQVYPLPENHGNPMRTMNFVRAFKEIYGDRTEIDLIFKYGNQKEGEGFCFEHEFQLKDVPFKKNASNILTRIVKGVPLQVSEFDNSTTNFFQSLVMRRNYNFILFRYLTSTQLGHKLPPQLKSRTIVDYDDVASSSLFDRHGDSSVGVVKRTIAWTNRLLLKKYENKCLDLGAALFCSQSDMEMVLIQKKIRNAFVIPNIYNHSSYEKQFPGDGYRNGNSLLFVGTLNYVPNIEGLAWFVNTVFNPFLDEYKDANLVVVGRKPADPVKKLCDEHPRIQLYADVPDIKPYYDKCKAVVVPLLAGSGTRIKILEAAMMKRPVLSTPTGAAGLEFRDGKDIHLFENAKTFKIKYQQLGSQEGYKQMVTSAESCVQTTYAKSNFSQSFKKVLEYIADQSS